MVRHGNVPAEHRKLELQQLQQMLDALFETNRPGLISDFDIDPLRTSSMTNQNDARHENNAHENDEVAAYNQLLPPDFDLACLAGMDQMESESSQTYYNTGLDLEVTDDWLWNHLTPATQ
ncbi:hypothetical protein PVAG01_07023 [Phlyctema vagabunda]|uniref:Uncharacterized protein n=1 Tax=Phlyctema vagabunda TaxID=108571 RepID=A0ABR4PBB9_9HELO